MLHGAPWWYYGINTLVSGCNYVLFVRRDATGREASLAVQIK